MQKVTFSCHESRIKLLILSMNKNFQDFMQWYNYQSLPDGWIISQNPNYKNFFNIAGLIPVMDTVKN